MSIDTPGAAQKAITVGAYNSFTGDVWNESSRDPHMILVFDRMLSHQELD